MADYEQEKITKRSRSRDRDPLTEDSGRRERSEGTGRENAKDNAAGRKIFAGSLAYETTEDDLRTTFGRYGEIEKCEVIINRDTGLSRGFGFVTFIDTRDAEEAILRLNNEQLHGRQIRLTFATERSERNRDLGSRGGGRVGYDDRRGGFDDRRGGYDDRRGSGYGGSNDYGSRAGYDERRGGGGGYDERRGGGGGYDERRGGGEGYRGGYQGGGGGGYNGGGYNGGGRGGYDSRGGSPRARGGPCYAFQKGECKYGNDCRYSHDDASSIGRGGDSRDSGRSRSPGGYSDRQGNGSGGYGGDSYSSGGYGASSGGASSGGGGYSSGQGSGGGYSHY